MQIFVHQVESGETGTLALSITMKDIGDDESVSGYNDVSFNICYPEQFFFFILDTDTLTLSITMKDLSVSGYNDVSFNICDPEQLLLFISDIIVHI